AAIRMRVSTDGGIHIAPEDTGPEQHGDARRTIHIRGSGVVICALQIVIVADKVPAQAQVDSKVRLEAATGLSKDAVRAHPLVEVEIAAGLLDVLLRLGIDTILPANA